MIYRWSLLKSFYLHVTVKNLVDSRRVNSKCLTRSATAAAGRGAPSGWHQGEPIEELIFHLVPKINVSCGYGEHSQGWTVRSKGCWHPYFLSGITLGLYFKCSSFQVRLISLICSVFCCKLILTFICFFPSSTGSERSFQIQFSCLWLLLHHLLYGQIWFALLQPYGIDWSVRLEDTENLVYAKGAFPNVDPRTGTVFQLLCQWFNFQCSPN